MTLASNIPRAIITGITGQDGSYLAELLLGLGYEVHGVVRNRAKLGNIADLRNQVVLHTVELGDLSSVISLLDQIKPNEYYHLAAPTSIAFSLREPMLATFQIGHFVQVALEAIRQSGAEIRFMQAGSSEMFGRAASAPQNESTPFHPRNPYASAKVFAHHLVQNYRDHFGLFACNAILFNHESPRRGLDFVTRKISIAVARIKLGLERQLVLGSLDALRDWAYAGDFVTAFHSMLQQTSADDYVLGTGVLTSVKDFVQLAFEQVGLNWQDHVVVDPNFVRRNEPTPLVADSSVAQARLGWKPTHSVEAIVNMMVQHDLELNRRYVELHRIENVA